VGDGVRLVAMPPVLQLEGKTVTRQKLTALASSALVALGRSGVNMPLCVWSLSMVANFVSAMRDVRRVARLAAALHRRPEDASGKLRQKRARKLSSPNADEKSGATLAARQRRTGPSGGRYF
jgi:hypothetical protein